MEQNVDDAKSNHVNAEDPTRDTIEEQTTNEDIKKGAANASGQEATDAGEVGVLKEIELSGADDAGEDCKIKEDDAAANVHFCPHDTPRGVHTRAESAEAAEEADNVIEVANGNLHLGFFFSVEDFLFFRFSLCLLSVIGSLLWTKYLYVISG